MDRSTHQAAGFVLMLGIFAAVGLALGLRQGVRDRKRKSAARAPDGRQARAPVQAADRPWRFESVFAGMVAYGLYVAAALWAGAGFPKFLQDHLFDGLAPAALVGVLVSLVLRDDPRTILPWIWRPWLILVLFLISGALISGLIAAAAIFSSATNDYGSGIAFVAGFGGFLFALVYWLQVGGDRTDRGTRRSRARWWWAKRPRPDEGHDVTVRAMRVDPRDQRWESDRPAYRVDFWQPAGSGAGSGWQSEEWELTEADVDEVLAWADRRAAGRTMTVWVVHQDTGGVGLIRLVGIDPTADREAWPSWAAPRPG